MLHMQKHVTDRAAVNFAACHVQSGHGSIPHRQLLLARHLAKPHRSMGLADVPGAEMTRSPCALQNSNITQEQGILCEVLFQ